MYTSCPSKVGSKHDKFVIRSRGNTFLCRRNDLMSVLGRICQRGSGF